MTKQTGLLGGLAVLTAGGLTLLLTKKEQPYPVQMGVNVEPYVYGLPAYWAQRAQSAYSRGDCRSVQEYAQEARAAGFNALRAARQTGKNWAKAESAAQDAKLAKLLSKRCARA